MKKLFAIFAAVAALVSCKGPKSESDMLVLYYSQTGTTKAVAEKIQKETGADIELIEAVQAYDGTFNETIARSQQEMNAGTTPEIKPIKSDLSRYKVVFLGYPVWMGTYALPVATFLKENADALKGVKVVTFCTFGSGGLNTSTDDMKEALPGSQVVEGYGVRTARIDAIDAEVDEFLIVNGFKEGTVEPKPEFSELTDVTPVTTEIFNKACSSYQFSLGTPVREQHRSIKNGTEYKYQVSSGMGGAGSIIYVIDVKGKEPEFTQVIR